MQILACADLSSLLRNSIVTSSLVNASPPFFFFFLFKFVLVSGGGWRIAVGAKAAEEWDTLEGEKAGADTERTDVVEVTNVAWEGTEVVLYELAVGTAVEVVDGGKGWRLWSGTKDKLVLRLGILG